MQVNKTLNLYITYFVVATYLDLIHSPSGRYYKITRVLHTIALEGITTIYCNCTGYFRKFISMDCRWRN